MNYKHLHYTQMLELKEHQTITEEFKFNIYEYEFKSEPKHLILKHMHM